MNLIAILGPLADAPLSAALAPGPTLPPSTVTPETLAGKVGPTVAAMLRQSQPQVRHATGNLLWVTAYPSWFIYTRDAVVSVIIRLGIEKAIAWLAPIVLPFLEPMEPLVARIAPAQVQQYAADLLALLRSDAATFLPAARLSDGELAVMDHQLKGEGGNARL